MFIPALVAVGVAAFLLKGETDDTLPGGAIPAPVTGEVKPKKKRGKKK